MASDIDTVGLASKMALYTGLLSLGGALGATVGLEAVQAVCLSSSTVASGELSLATIQSGPTNICWENARTMKTVGDVFGYFAAILLLGGAVLDTFDERVREVVHRQVSESA